MKRLLLTTLALAAIACGGSDMPKKPDPYLTVRVRNQLDTTTAPGRAHWHTYILLTGPYTALNGVSFQGTFSLTDIRHGISTHCMSAGADSVGQRFLSLIAVADTTTEQLTADATAQSIVTAWYNGNHNLPSGWMAITTTPADAWDSDQFAAGHGLVPSDPIKWGWDWSGVGNETFFERTDTEVICDRY